MEQAALRLRLQQRWRPLLGNIRGHQLSRDEALQLLAMSATKSVNSYENPQQDGPGILNTYKISSLASRLKNQCRGANWNQCIQDSPTKPTTYEFAVDPNIGKAKAAFPDCFGSGGTRTASNCEQEAAFKKIRAQALLTGDSSYSGVACIYKSLQFSNAEYFEKYRDCSTLSDLPSMLGSRDAGNRILGAKVMGTNGASDANSLSSLKHTIEDSGDKKWGFPTTIRKRFGVRRVRISRRPAPWSS